MSNFLTPQPSPDRNKYAIIPVDNLMSDAEWDFSSVAPEDVIGYESYQGFSTPYLSFIVNPVTSSTNRSYLSKVGNISSPCEIKSALSIAYRDQRTTPYLVAYDSSNTRTGYTQETINITALSQTTTTLTITLATPFAYSPGTIFSIEDCADTRFNYLMCNVSWVAEDKLSIQTTTQSFDTLPSITASATTAVLRIYPDALLNYADGAGFIFSGTGITGAELIARTNGNSYPIGVSPSSVGGNRRVSILTTNASLSSYGEIAVRCPSTEYRLDIEPSSINFYDRALNSTSGGLYNNRGAGNINQPTLSRSYKTSVGVIKETNGYTKPVANITAISRTSNVATITLNTTAAAAGITTSTYIHVYGVRDTTNFANTNFGSVLPTSVTGNTVTIAWTGTNATSYGGAVSIVHGQIAQPQLLSHTIQTVEIVNTNMVKITGHSNWGTINAGDIVYVVGAVDATGNSLGIDGMWRVGRLATTLCVLSPVIDRLGVRKSPTVAALAATSSGGAILCCTRIMLANYTTVNKSIQETRIYGQGTAALNNSIPVIVTSSATVAVNQGTGLTGTNGTAGWPVTAGCLWTEDRASAALSTTSTSSPIAHGLTGGSPLFQQISVVVSAVTGTSPTMQIGIEYQEHSTGAWVHLWHIPRITAAGTYRTPFMPIPGRNIRYVYTLGGTTPVFTFSVQRQSTSQGSYVPRIQWQSYDMTNAATVGAVIGGASTAIDTSGAAHIEIVVYCASATTMPGVVLQGSVDGGVSWWNLTSSITAQAGVPQRTAVTDMYPALARAVTATAGSGIVGGYVHIKASGM